MKRLAWYAVIVLTTLLALRLLWELRSVVVLVLLSMATASAFRPLIAGFEKRRLSRGLSLALAYLVVFGALAVLVFLSYRPLLNDLQAASNRLTIFYDSITVNWPAGTPAQQTIAEQLPSTRELTLRMTGEEGARSIQTLVGLTGNIFWFFGQVGLILILSIYWSADFLRIERLWLALLPVEARTQARETYRAIEAGLGAYIRSEAIQSVLAGVMLWAGYQVLGMPYSVLLALLGALAWLVPWFGAILAVIAPLLVGLSAGGIPMAALAVGYTLLVLFFQEWVIEPRFFTRETYSSVILVVMVLILGEEFGLLGLVMAPLVSAAAQITLRYLAQPPVTVSPEQIGAAEIEEQLAALQTRVQDLQIELEAEADDGSSHPGMLNLMERLKKLLADTKGYIGENPERIVAKKPQDDAGQLPLPGRG